MQFSRPDEKTVRLARLDALLSELLRRIPKSADPGDNPAARARLFSAPSHDRAEAALAEDWRQYVEPELARLFSSAIEVIDGDLQTLKVATDSAEGLLTIPTAHLESWIHGLNQARLALTARYDFTDRELERIVPLEGPPRALALLQVRFYGILQELFLREIEGD